MMASAWAAQRQGHRLRAADRAQLREDRGDVKLHRVARDGEARGDDPVVRAVGHQLEDLALARGQRRPLSRGRIAGQHRRQRLRMEDEETGVNRPQGARELVRRRAERQRRAQPERAGGGRPEAGGIVGERDDGRAPRPRGNGAQHPARLGVVEHERDDRLWPLVQQPAQLPRRADLDPPARERAQRGFHARRLHRGVSDDDHHPRPRVPAHVTPAADATKRRTSLIGIASARPPAIIVLMPTT
jgi:hypothetical protein